MSASKTDTTSPHYAEEKHERPKRTRFFQWVPTDHDQLERAESHLLRPIEHLLVKRNVGGINTISSLPHHGGEPRDNVVLLHGFAGGLGCWVQNWESLARVANVHAIDLPGFARSERPKMSFRDTDDVVHFYSQRLDAWLEELNIKKPVILVGHSFGAYLAARYAHQRGASYVKHVVLADPWGVPEMPTDQTKKLPMKYRCLLSVFYNVSPLSVLRAAGPWGPSLMPKVRPDFADRWNSVLEDPMIFYDYTFHCNARRPTGELAFQACCQGPAYAKQPLESVLPGSFPTDVKLTVFSGSHTWMDRNAALRLVNEMQKKGHASCSWSMVQDAGHQLNTDNAPLFNSMLLDALESDS